MTSYKNPIIKGFNPDPSICRVGDDYYLVTSTFEFSPGVPIYHSRNLVDWELISYCLTDEVQLPLTGALASKGIFAPTIRYHEGIYYMCTTNISNGGNFYVTTKDIRGKWSKPIWVNMGGIDPTIYFDEDGKVYFTTNLGLHIDGVGIAEIDIQSGKLLNEPVWISNGTGGSFCEAPHIYKIEGMYYLLLAEGGILQGHIATIHRSSNIYGPYESCPHNPIVTHRNSGSAPIQAVGHGDLVWDQHDHCWMVLLGIREIPGGHLHNLGRETFLAPVVWENGWPLVGKQGRVQLEMEGPLPAAAVQQHQAFIETFVDRTWSLAWNWIRNRNDLAYKLEEEGLRLINQGVNLSSPDQSPCFMGIRQQEFDMCFEVLLQPATGCWGGITAYYNDSQHYDVFIREDQGCYWVGVRKKLYDIDFVVQEVQIESCEAIRLRITADQEFYHFYYSVKDEAYISIGQGMTAALCSEITRTTSFTGTYFGVFADAGEILVKEVTCK